MEETGWNASKILVHKAEDGSLEVDHATLSLLNSIPGPVHVVAMVGPYRTGKSHLLSVFAEECLGKVNAFQVGASVQASTKGISILCSPHPSIRGHWLILLDTEGLNDVENGDRMSDMLIFVLAVLLSSTLIYNSRNVIDFQAIEMLHYVSVLSERIRVMPDGGEDDGDEDMGFDLAFPEFIWVVRDFQLNLEQNGTKITDDEYLENALTAKKGENKPNQVSVKRCLREYFVKRKCFLLPNLIDAKRCAAASSAAGSNQQDKLDSLIQYILSSDCKMNGGSEVTGIVFGRLVKEYVDEAGRFDSRQPIDVQSIMNKIANTENEKAVVKSLDLYRNLMQQETKEALPEVALHQAHLRCSERSTMTLMQSAIYPFDSSFAKLMEEIRKDFDKISDDNTEKVKTLCEKTFRDLRKEFIGESNSKYFCAGGYRKYREDMTELRKKWDENSVLQGNIGRDFFIDKLKRLRDSEAQLIMNADQNLTQLKKQDEVKCLEVEKNQLEEKSKCETEKSLHALKETQSQFEEKVSSHAKSTILKPETADLSKLSRQVTRLEHQVRQLKLKNSKEETDNYEHRLQKYRKMLLEKQEKPSRWLVVASTIETFARDAYNILLKRLMKHPEPVTKVQTDGAS